MGAVASFAALQAVLAEHKPGDRVRARVHRNGADITVLVTLGSLAS
jgi:S1-C subfamily serine protease